MSLFALLMPIMAFAGFNYLNFSTQINLISPNGNYAVGYNTKEIVEVYDVANKKSKLFSIDKQTINSYEVWSVNSNGVLAGSINEKACLYDVNDNVTYLPIPTDCNYSQAIDVSDADTFAIGYYTVGNSGWTGLYYPCYWVKADNNWTIHDLPIDDVDQWNSTPKWREVISMSADGKRIFGLMLDMFNLYPRYIVWDLQADGSWSYKYLCEELIFKAGVERPKGAFDRNWSQDQKNIYKDSVAKCTTGKFIDPYTVYTSENGRYIGGNYENTVANVKCHTPFYYDLQSDTLVELTDFKDHVLSSVTDAGVLALGFPYEEHSRNTNFYNVNDKSLLDIQEYANTFNTEINLRSYLTYNYKNVDSLMAGTIFMSQDGRILGGNYFDYNADKEDVSVGGWLNYIIDLNTGTPVDIVREELPFNAFFDANTSILTISDTYSSMFVINTAGALMYSSNSASSQVDLSALTSGCYVAVAYEGNKIKTLKFIVR